MFHSRDFQFVCYMFLYFVSQIDLLVQHQIEGVAIEPIHLTIVTQTLRFKVQYSPDHVNNLAYVMQSDGVTPQVKH